MKLEKKSYKIYFKAGFTFGAGLSVGRMFDVTCLASSKEDAESKFWKDIRFGGHEIDGSPLTCGIRIVRIESEESI